MVKKLNSNAVVSAAQEELDACGMPSLAMTYSPIQAWECVYDAETGLARGTIFPGLDKPFLEGACPSD
jgi:hypothetical protein